jgi:hypothetical protein
MKRLILLFFLLVTGFSFRVSNPAMMMFDDLKHNFGFIHQGDIVSHAFVFTNTGQEPLIITEAKVTCECTKVAFPKQPVSPGKKDSVVVTYDSKSAMDRQERTVVIASNAQNSPTTLTFKCVVLKKK